MAITIVHPRILEAFGLDFNHYQIERFGSGLINNTFRLHGNSGRSRDEFILQRINTHVFKNPEAILNNHRRASEYLAQHHPAYFFIAPVQLKDGKFLLEWNGDYWRMLPFVAHTFTVNEADDPGQAFEAAKQFGRLAHNLAGIDLSLFTPTIPNFHNLTLRYSSFQSAINDAEVERREQAADLIEEFEQFSQIPITYEELKTDSDFPDRLMHHDTKINNVLLDDKTGEGICVIDLDTLMPGKLISDIGDMVRTYVSPVSEEETDFSRIIIRDDYYEALMRGYLPELGNTLTKTEKEMLFYAGQFMVYMQGIRFLTDFLNGDVYYPTKYPAHNYDRAKNQLTLLERLNEKEAVLKKIIRKYLK
ncbi:MAG: aminoglycoside phosphotransferase family protein [Chitinophagaceae bacterium]|nr:MAG: aminoglycoside phosphotransferase family protein [Chitinophagaceae bacterium]